MKAVYKKIFFVFLISFGIGGGGAILLVIWANNVYVASYFFLMLFLFIALLSMILFVIGFILLISKEKSALWVLLSAILIPSFFVSSGLIAKYFEIGAFREKPMVSFIDEVSNIVVFKEGTTNDQINDFWEKSMAIERADGRGHNHLPGVRTMGRNQSRNGHEIIVFDFFPNATEEQKQIVFAKVKSSPLVYSLLENQSIKEFNATPENPNSIVNSDKSTKKVFVKDSTSSK